MNSKTTFQWKLTGINGETGFVFTNQIPSRKVKGLFYPTGEENAICAFNPRSGETLTVQQFMTVSNLCAWHHKCTTGWTLVEDYKFYPGALTLVTFNPPAPVVETEEDPYWG